jgi:hypothetical protein
MQKWQDDEERILREILKAKGGYAHRLSQCFIVNELAEVLAVNFSEAGPGGIPQLKEDLPH